MSYAKGLLMHRTLLKYWRVVARVIPVLMLLVSAGCRIETARNSGVEYRHITDPAPWSAHVVSFDLAQRDLAVLASVGTGVDGSETLPEMVTELPHGFGEPVAAVNGDYFEYLTEPRYRGTLQGLCIVNGEIVSGPAGFAFWVDGAKHSHIGKVQGAFTATWPDGTAMPFGLNCSTSDYQSEVRAADVVLYTPAFGTSTQTEGGLEYLLEPVNTNAWLPLRPNVHLQARIREVRTTGNTPLATGLMVLSIARKADNHISPLKVGEIVKLSTQLTPDLSNAQTAVSGDPLLMTGGQIVPGLDKIARHPRTAVGFAGSRCCFANSLSPAASRLSSTVLFRDGYIAKYERNTLAA